MGTYAGPSQETIQILQVMTPLVLLIVVAIQFILIYGLMIHIRLPWK